MAKVLITVPNEGWVRWEVAVAVAGLLLNPCGHKVYADGPRYKPYENYLHHTRIAVLDGGYDYWLSMDSDNPPVRNPLELVVLDKDIMGCPTPIWKNLQSGDRPWCLNGFDSRSNGEFGEHQPQQGLQRVDAIGSGCMLIARRVLEHPALQHAPFRRDTDDAGRVIRGADLAFCKRAREAGLEIWMHYDYQCLHWNETELCELSRVVAAMMERQQSDILDTFMGVPV